MHDKQRRGRRAALTVLVSERRVPGGREFVFAPVQPAQGRPARPQHALMTARSFSWGEDVPAANDPSVTDDAAANDRDLAEFLLALRAVYRTRHDER